MTARTHDLAAFTALLLLVIYKPVSNITLATTFASLGANFFGALCPDLDNSTSEVWEKIRGGRLIGRIIPPLFGGHRYITHSLVGLLLFGWLGHQILYLVNDIVLVDIETVWHAFMVGIASHLIIDTFTKEGVMWFFPFPWKVGIPPFKTFRIKTGGLVEKSIIFPLLLITNAYLVWRYYPVLISTLIK